MSSASMESERSNMITNASFFCSTFCGSFSQVGPARPITLAARAKSKVTLSHVPEDFALSSRSTDKSSLLIALSHLERPRVFLTQNCISAAKGINANKHSGRKK